MQRYRYRFVRTNEDLLRYLPTTDATLFFLNVSVLRQGGYLQLLSGVSAKQDRDYLGFVRQTGFDYTQDVEAVAGAAAGERIEFVVLGRFHWMRLRAYAAAHGGKCAGEVCQAPTSTPHRWASFRSIQPDVLAVVVDSNPTAVQSVERGPDLALVPKAPVWVRPAHALLTNPTDLPVALRIFALSLQSAEAVWVSIETAETPENAFRIEADAAFANEAMAETARTQMEIDTRMMKLELARERKQPADSDLSGLLVAGTFQASQGHLTAEWPVKKALLRSLE